MTITNVTAGSIKNTFNTSDLVNKVVDGLLKVSSESIGQFANDYYAEIFEAENKTWAPGTKYTVALPSYPVSCTGSDISSKKTNIGKQVRYETINIDPEEGRINWLAEYGQIEQQLYMGSPQDFERVFLSPMYERAKVDINRFYYNALARGTRNAVLPRSTDDRGGGNEAWGVVKKCDVAFMTRILDFMENTRMTPFNDFTLVMNSSAYWDMVQNVLGSIGDGTSSDLGPRNRAIPNINEQVLRTGEIKNIMGIDVFHTPDIPTHIGGSYTNSSSVKLNFFGFINSLTLPSTFNDTSADQTLVAPTYANTGKANSACVGYLIIQVTGATVIYLKANDMLVLDSNAATNLYRVDLIGKSITREKFTCAVASTDSITYTVTGTAAAYIAVPVNALPYGKEQPELQAVTCAHTPTSQEYAVSSTSNVYIRAAVNKVGSAEPLVKIIASHTKCFIFSKNGLSRVNPRLANIEGAKNILKYDKDSRTSMLCTIQGDVNLAKNTLRLGTLLGTGVFGDAVCMFPYQAPYLSV